MAPSPSMQNLIAAEVTARGPRPFTFRIVIQADWKVAKVFEEPLSPETPLPIAIFEDPATPQISVQALGVVLEQEISAANWLHHYLDMREWSAVEVDERGPRRARAISDFDVEGVAMTTVISATVNGSTLVLLQGVCPAALFETAKDPLLLAINSFSTGAAADPNVIEPWVAVPLSPGIDFDFPASWSMRRQENAALGRNAVDFIRSDESEAVQGVIRLKSIARRHAPALKDALAATLSEFADAGVDFDGEADPQSVAPFEPFARVMTLSLTGQTNPDHVLEFRSYAMEYDGGIVVASCLGPVSTADFHEWAINSRAFEIAIASLRIAGEVSQRH